MSICTTQIYCLKLLSILGYSCYTHSLPFQRFLTSWICFDDDCFPQTLHKNVFSCDFCSCLTRWCSLSDRLFTIAKHSQHIARSQLHSPVLLLCSRENDIFYFVNDKNVRISTILLILSVYANCKVDFLLSFVFCSPWSKCKLRFLLWSTLTEQIGQTTGQSKFFKTRSWSPWSYK